MERSYATVLRFLEALIRYGNIGKPSSNLSGEGNLIWMRYFIKHCELEPRQDSVIHLAGTKGKGTTAVMCEALLRNAGLRTAVFTSPHLSTVRERIRLNGGTISENTFIRAFFYLYDLITKHYQATRKETEHVATLPMEPDCFASFVANSCKEVSENVNSALPRSLFFGFVTLLFLTVAKQDGAEVLIVETGIGGRLDATNAIQGVALSGITSIGHDHMEVLGNSLEEIANEKAGIIRIDRPVVVSSSIGDNDHILSVFHRRAKQCKATLFIASRSIFPSADQQLKCLKGSHMVENAALAASMVYLYLNPRYTKIRSDAIMKLTFSFHNHEYTADYAKNPLSIPLTETECTILNSVCFAGRSHVHVSQKTGSVFLLDGAHTPESMALCARWAGSIVKDMANIRRVSIFFACNHPRDPHSLMNSFFNEAASFLHLVTDIVILRAASQAKSLIGELHKYESASDGEDHSGSANEKSIQWQHKQANDVRRCLRESNNIKLRARAPIDVSEIYLSKDHIRKWRTPDSCIIACGSFYHVGELLSILASEDE
ncbi:folylpolyglutamate synthase mitochondrial-like protein [Perkinsela sp. CCAP 1560/4]|nr:folylpolyglutamate synthase mitochondrial-like protein [Perkinsela sp. CCAP 1560/4]KNH05031.1 folylpolyglutamate synthase mitochondrial-like protein [Perkinsela sp. CCAP 1560/4]|eukprot:KNH05022.1 folylpolyglutamate synthase mitochondrial-like protein [Perkinsela sp. CCAP 1560/4]